jgi:hypothetical protein
VATTNYLIFANAGDDAPGVSAGRVEGAESFESWARNQDGERIAYFVLHPGSDYHVTGFAKELLGCRRRTGFINCGARESGFYWLGFRGAGSKGKGGRCCDNPGKGSSSIYGHCIFNK